MTIVGKPARVLNAEAYVVNTLGELFEYCDNKHLSLHDLLDRVQERQLEDNYQGYVIFTLAGLMDYCGHNDVSFEEVFQMAEAKFLEKVDPESTKDGVPKVQE